MGVYTSTAVLVMVFEYLLSSIGVRGISPIRCLLFSVGGRGGSPNKYLLFSVGVRGVSPREMIVVRLGGNKGNRWNS